MSRLARVLLCASLLAACGEKEQEQSPPPSDRAATPPPAPAEPPAKPPEPAAAPDAAAAAPAPAPAPSAEATPDPPAAKGEFDQQAKELFRVVACGGSDPVPERIPAKLVDSHCAAFEKIIAEYQSKWLDKARPFLAEVVPADLPDRVLYPFGGSDLITALATFPEAREITIISLEKSGDVRAIEKLKTEDLARSLKENRDHLTFLLRSAFHKTVDLKAMSENGLPGELVDDMVALRVHGRAPLTMRYFKIKEDGSLEYVADHVANVEISFQKPGGAVQTYRHVSADLSDGGLKHNPGLMAYMKARAPFTAMTKASSFLLWEPYFSTIRNFLLENMVWMISDATGPLPEHAKKAGFEQVPYGDFTGPEPAFPNLKHKEEMMELWAKSEKRPCPIRYGYSDAKRRPHLLITRKKAAAK
jgi:hypothetical protein